MAQKLKPFGEGSMGHENGYDLPLLTGWIENLVDTEEARPMRPKGRLAKRLNLVQDGLQKLQEALEIGNEE